MLIGLEAILPLFIIIGCGYLARRTLLDESMLPAVNVFVYYFAVPALLFRAAMEMSLEGILYWPGIMGFLSGIALTLVLLFALMQRFAPAIHREEKIVIAMNGTFANFAYMGIPLTFTVLGEGAGPVTVMIILMGNLLIIGGTHVALEAGRQHQIRLNTLLTVLNNSLLRNPVFISTVLGLLFSLLGLWLPSALDKSIQWLADAAIPVALFCLGAGLKFRGLTTSSKLLPIIMAVKLIIHPALTWFSFWLFDVEDSVWLAATVLLTALPTGALAHVVALKYNRFHKETSRLIVLSTLLSSITVSLWVSLII